MQTEVVFEVLRQIAIIITTLAAGGPGVVWLVNKIKTRFSIEGDWAFVLAAGVSLVVGLAAALTEGVLAIDTLQVENISNIVLFVFFTSQAYYWKTQRENGLGSAD